jgi:hypothetical protein
MNFRKILPLSAAALFVASCAPLPDPPKAPADPAERRLSAEEERIIREKREALAKRDEAREQADAALNGGQTTDPAAQTAEQKGKQLEDVNPDATAQPAQPKVVSYPTAKPVPGKAGFVFSPYNNRQINVQGFNSGVKVADPYYPKSEKKYFIVP